MVPSEKAKTTAQACLAELKADHQKACEAIGKGTSTKPQDAAIVEDFSQLIADAYEVPGVETAAAPAAAELKPRRP